MGQRHGVRPDIERILTEASPEERPQLLEELLRMEFELRKTAGIPPTATEYLGRFPAEAELIDRLLRELETATVPADHRVVGDDVLLKEIGRGGEEPYTRRSSRGSLPEKWPSSCLTLQGLARVPPNNSFSRRSGRRPRSTTITSFAIWVGRRSRPALLRDAPHARRKSGSISANRPCRLIPTTRPDS